MRTRIIVDSTADVPAALRERMLVVPLTILFGEEAFIDGVTMDHEQFYQKLASSDVLPTTSQPSPDTFEQVYAQVQQAGEEAVVLTISSKLSGTYQSACIAAEDYPNVHVVDSLTATLGTGVLAMLALRLADEGLDARTIAARLTEERERVHLIAAMDTLEYLKRGGRLSATAALAGSLLNIKPVIAIPGGEIAVLGKARGTKRSFTMMAEETEKTGGIDFDLPVLAGYTGLSGEGMEQYLRGNADQWADHSGKVEKTSICGVVGTHSGPGAVAVAFFHNK